MTAPLVSIIILNYNGKNYLAECLTSVLSQTNDSCEVILVDNASTDGSVAFVEERFPQTRIIRNKENLGYAGGNNRGVEESHGLLIILLNNDTRVESGWLEELKKAVEPENVAIASSLIRTEGVPDRYYEKNGTINFVGMNIMRAFDQPTDIFYCSGASLIYKKEILGIPFDSDYFAYAEDVYVSLRARFLGYEVKHTNASRVHHYGSATSKKALSRRVTYFQERNRLLNVFLFFNPLTLVRLAPFILVNCVLKLLLSVFSSRWSFIGLVQSYGWFIGHVSTIIRKRKHLKRDKRVSQLEVISRMSGKLMNGENTFERVINGIALSYCHLVGLRTIEMDQ